MPSLRLSVGGTTHHIPVLPEQSLRDALDTTDFRVRSACKGIGACGLCRIRVIEGDAGGLTSAELYHLSAQEQREAVRLACQVKPSSDLFIEIVSPAPESHWKSLPFPLVHGPRRRFAVDDLRPPSVSLPHPLGLAVDIGTTNISLSLYLLSNGESVAERWGPNPQAEFGADVVSRLTAAATSPNVADKLSGSLVEIIHEGLWDIVCREGFDLGQVLRVAIVGNTAMLALLAGKGYKRLLEPKHWAEPIDCAPRSTSAWVRDWGVHSQAEVDVIPPLAGFVGSDLLAGLIATGLVQESEPALFVDFGTNSEIALWSGSALWVTAAAGGPAFESSGIRHGVPAETGAVFRVSYDAVRDQFGFAVLGDVVAKGICGSGLVDLVAALRHSGRLTETGRLLDGGEPVADFAFTAGGKSLAITNRDIDALQRAKAAIAAGITELCARAGLDLSELRRVCVAGAFGHYLDVPNAQAIGLLPPVSPERVELVGNTALAGCSDFLLYQSVAVRMASLRAKARMINLAHSPDFDELFLSGLYLRPSVSQKNE